MKNHSIVKIDLIFLSIFLQSFSFLAIKYASLYGEYKIVLMGVAFVFIVSRAYIWQIVLKYNELSRVYPFNSLVQVLIFIYAIVLFGEDMNIYNIVGLLLMVVGIITLGKK